MTIKEFAVKYMLQYHVAYKASFMVKPIATMNRDRDYDEKELHDATVKYLKRRLREIKGLHQQYYDALNQLNKQ